MKNIAYITGCFGSLSHTFLRREVREMQAMGLDIELYGIRPDASDTLTPQERSLVDRTIYLYPLKIKELIGAKLFFMFRYPSLYLRTLLRALTNEERHPLHYLKMVYHFGIATYLARHMLRQNIQHIHAHFMNVSATQAMYCAGLLDVPFSITNHTGSIKSVKGMIGLREKIRRAQWIGTISDHSRKHLETIYPCREKCHVVRCGLDLTAYAFSPDHHELKTPGLVRLLGIGRMIEVKGFRYLIQAMALLKKNQIPAKLTLIGDGPLREDLKTLAKTEEVSQDVDFVGYRSQEDVVRAFQEHDIVIVPSITAKDGVKEGLPVVLMEAMACGVPVIASEYSGIPELVSDQAGLLSVPEDAQSIAAAVSKFLGDPDLRRRCIREGRRKVETEFDIKKIAQLKRALLEESLA